MTETQSADLFQQLFDTLDIAIDSMPIRTGDIVAKNGGRIPSGAEPKRAPQPAVALRPVARIQPVQVDSAVGPAEAVKPLPPNVAPLPASEVDAFFAQNAAYAEACKQLHAGNVGAARATLEALANECPNVSEFQSAYAYARFKLTSDGAHRLEEMRKLEQVVEAYPSCASSRVFLSRVLIELERVQTAVRHLKEATELVPERADVLAELRRANELLTEIRKGVEPSVAAKDVPAAVFREEADKKTVVQTLMVVLALCGIVFVVFVVAGLGRDEEFHPLSQAIRAVVLLAAGLGAAFTFLKDQKLSAADFQLSRGGALASVLVGAAGGAVLSGAITRGPMVVVAGLAVLRVVSEEVFFRVFLGRSLDKLSGAWRAPLVAGLLFGLYHLTFSRVWTNVEPGDGAMYILSITALAGIPYAFLQHRTRSVLPPFAAHLIVSLAAAVASSH